MSCGCQDSTTPVTCTGDCPDANPCESGCLDIIDTTCVEFTSTLPTCLNVASGDKLDSIILEIDQQICGLKNGNDKLVRASITDTASGYLSDKIKTCNYLTKSTVMDGGVQKVNLCLDTTALVSQNANNPIFVDVDGINIDYTKLVNTIINNPTLLSALCTALSGCVA